MGNSIGNDTYTEEEFKKVEAEIEKSINSIIENYEKKGFMVFLKVVDKNGVKAEIQNRFFRNISM